MKSSTITAPLRCFVLDMTATARAQQAGSEWVNMNWDVSELHADVAALTNECGSDALGSVQVGQGPLASVH